MSAGACRTAHPCHSMRGTITRPSAHRDGTSRRVRLVMNAHGWCGDRSIDAAARDPASANMIPMEGKTKVSHTQPKAWFSTTRTSAAARRTSM